MEENLEADILSQALPVAKLPNKIDLNTAPATGEEYLSRVRLEATKNQIVIAKNVDVKKFEKNRTTQIFQLDQVQETRKEFKASREWQCQKSSEFSQLRDKVRKEKNNFVKTYPLDKEKYNFSNLKSKKEWFSFCYGKKSKESNEQSTEGNEPCLSILYSLSQSQVVDLFDYHVEWITSYGFSRKRFEWAFCLMCFLEKPLLPETHSSLRDLARQCIKIRSELIDPNDDKLQELNYFISIIGRYFEQTDLADQDD